MEMLLIQKAQKFVDRLLEQQEQMPQAWEVQKTGKVPQTQKAKFEDERVEEQEPQIQEVQKTLEMPQIQKARKIMDELAEQQVINEAEEIFDWD